MKMCLKNETKKKRKKKEKSQGKHKPLTVNKGDSYGMIHPS